MWLTLLQLGVPLGIVMGYAMTAIIVSFTTWKWAFWGQSVMLIILLFVYFSYPTKYYIEKSRLDEQRERAQNRNRVHDESQIIASAEERQNS
jgi:predicted MFS family arabinose efflux permease